MHLYWRVIEELKCLGEVVYFHDPSLLREYRRWLHKNSDAISMFSGPHYFPKPLLLGSQAILCGLN